MLEKLVEKILDNIKSTTRDTGVRLLDIVFLIELIYFIFFPNLIDKNLLVWDNMDFGQYLYNFGKSIYFKYTVVKIIIWMITTIILILLHLSEKYSSHLHHYKDGFNKGYSAFAGLMRFYRLIWYFLHNGWIIFLLISVLSKHTAIMNFPPSWLYTGINCLYLMYQLIKILCFTKEETIQIGNLLTQKTISRHYYVIDEGESYLFVKNTFLETPIFCLIKSKTELSSINYYVLDCSTNYNEIASEFDRRVNSSKSCFDVEIPERERPVRSEHENY